jgi:hypothetical protein
MRHLHAAQKAGDKLWHYVSSGRGGTYPIGYCAEGCPGHGSAEEACEHYRQYLLSERLRFDGGPEDTRTMYRCEAPGCDAFTAGSATVGGSRHWHLCEDHRTRDVVAGLLHVHESWVS